MLKSLKFTHDVFMDPMNSFAITLQMDGNHLIKSSVEGFITANSNFTNGKIEPEKCKQIDDLIEECELWTWHKNYHPEGYDVLDGFSWELKYEDTSELPLSNSNKLKIDGNNAYPWCFYKLIKALIIAEPALKDILEEYAKERKPVYCD